MQFDPKLSPATLKELGNLVKTCHKYRVGAVLATLLVVLVILAIGVSTAIAHGGLRL